MLIIPKSLTVFKRLFLNPPLGNYYYFNKILYFHKRNMEEWDSNPNFPNSIVLNSLKKFYEV